MVLFGWGSNNNGQLGTGDILDYHSFKEINIPSSMKIKKIVGGGSHTAILADNGSVYTCGNNTQNQLCRETSTDKNGAFKQVDIAFKVKNICCGWDSTCLVSDDNCIYIYGDSFCNKIEKFNTNNTNLTTNTFRFRFKVESLIVDISMGQSHILLCTLEGILYVFGFGKRGQLGLGCETRLIDVPTQVTIYPGCLIAKVSCGWEFSICLTNNNEVFAWGNNSYGQCGAITDDNIDIFQPLKVNLNNILKVITISTGWSHAIILLEDGKVICWGRNDFSQCGRSIHPCHPGYLNFQASCNISTVSCGAEHSLFLSEISRKLFLCGWNEHGSCAKDTLEFIRNPVSYDIEISKNYTCYIGTGYSHSFLYANVV